LFRPITLFPFPTAPLEELSRRVFAILVIEMNAGQMVEDVRQAIRGFAPVHFYGRMGGVVPLPDEILEQLQVLPMDLRPPFEDEFHQPVGLPRPGLRRQFL
jgi:2-oxoglutarate ferredoxin oxidoreductase subunit alpha